ncbi:MAG: hypothetical protein DRQ55_06685 [Planctomycetota bacterium]|nr:MAG: hypothetical protein DRQ55_06685 [Planctomycetota bacterium]
MTFRTCSEVRPLLMAYLDSELDATTTLGMSEHLSSCAPCRTRMEAEQSIENGVGQALRAERMPRDVGQRLDALQDSLRAGASRPDRSRSLLTRASGWAAAALVLMALGFWLRDAGSRDAAPASALNAAFASAYQEYVALPPRASDVAPGGLAAVLAQPRFAGLSLPASGFAGPADHQHPIRYLGARPAVVGAVEGVTLAYDCCGSVTSVLVLPASGLPQELVSQLPEGATLDLEWGGLKTRAVHRGGLIIGVSSRHSVVLADEITS